MINPGIVKFLEKLSSGFLITVKFVGVWTKLHTKMVKKAAQRKLIKFSSLEIGQSNPPLF